MAWQVARELHRQGETVTLVAREAEPAEGIGFVPVPAPGRRSPLRTLAFSRAAARVIRTHAFDVVHGFSRTEQQDLFRAGGGSHEDYLERMHSQLGRALRRALPRHRGLIALERRVFADPRQRIQCASRLVADRLVQHHGVPRERILLLPNAVDTERFDAVRHRAAGRALRAALDPEASRIWLLPASGWRRKGLDLALEALARLADPQARLWVAGRDAPGPWRQRAARAGVGDRVRFLGPRADLEHVFAAVDGLLLPTRYDPFANVTFEAAASGLPIVTTRANGAAEWLSADACEVVERLEGEAIAAALRARAAPEVRQRRGAAARREVAPHHWAGHVAALREEYARILAARRAAGRP